MRVQLLLVHFLVFGCHDTAPGAPSSAEGGGGGSVSSAGATSSGNTTGRAGATGSGSGGVSLGGGSAVSSNVPAAGAGAGGVGGSTPTGGTTSSGGDASVGNASLDGGTTGGAGGSPEVESPDAIAVAVGYGARRVRSSDGVEWTDFQEIDPEGGDDDNLFRGVGYGDGRFVAVGGAGQGFTMVSLDGITWTDENRTPRDFLSDVVALGDVFVAAGGNGLRLRSLDGGVSWVDEGPYFSGHFRAIAAGRGIAVAVGHSYNQDPDVGLVTTTSDGAEWSEIVAEGLPLRSVAFGNGVFVALGDEGRCSASDDGADWTTTTLDGARGDVCFAAGEFYVPSDQGYYHSADGEQWTRSGDSSRDIAGYFKGAFFSLGWPATISRSTTLDAWDVVFRPDGSGLTQIAVGVPGN